MLVVILPCPRNALNRFNFDSCASTFSLSRRNLSASSAASIPLASCNLRNRNRCSLATNNCKRHFIRVNNYNWCKVNVLPAAEYQFVAVVLRPSLSILPRLPLLGPINNFKILYSQKN